MHYLLVWPSSAQTLSSGIDIIDMSRCIYLCDACAYACCRRWHGPCGNIFHPIGRFCWGVMALSLCLLWCLLGVVECLGAVDYTLGLRQPYLLASRALWCGLGLSGSYFGLFRNGCKGAVGRFGATRSIFQKIMGHLERV